MDTQMLTGGGMEYMDVKMQVAAIRALPTGVLLSEMAAEAAAAAARRRSLRKRSSADRSLGGDRQRGRSEQQRAILAH